MKKIALAFICFTLLFTTSCKDKEETVEPVDLFATTQWRPTNDDNNTSTNPSGDFSATGTNFYYRWASCNQDDTFSFKDGKFTVDNGGTTCETDFLALMLANKDYAYNETTKTMTIGAYPITVYEFSGTQLKLGFPNPIPTSGPKNYVILLKKL
jgi:hypothetical protein